MYNYPLYIRMTTINFNNTSLLRNYPLDKDLMDYSSGTGSSTNVNNNTTATSTATTKLTSGSAYFNSTNTSGIQIQNIQIPTGGLTIAFWFKLNSIVSIPSFTLFEATVISVTISTNYLSISYDNTSSGIRVSTTENNKTLVTGSSITDTNWHHYCATVSSGGVWSFYIDGIAKSITLAAYPYTVGINDRVYICGSFSGAGIFGAKDAYINQFLLFNRVITPVELFHLVNNPSQVSINALPTSPAIQVPCFLEGSKILSFNPHTNEEIYVPIETLRKGDRIKTIMSGYVPIAHIGWKKMEDPAEKPERRDRLYGLYSDNTQDEPLYLTGRHSTLHPYLSPEHLEIVRQDMGNIYVTENHYRLPTHLDPRSKPYTDNKPVIIWHFALEHENREYNYGVYANGLFVESTSIEYMLEQSNMKLLD